MIFIQMRGKLERVVVDMNDQEFLSECNIAALQGKEFVLARKPGGEMVGINVRNILTFEESDDADLLV